VCERCERVERLSRQKSALIARLEAELKRLREALGGKTSQQEGDHVRS